MSVDETYYEKEKRKQREFEEAAEVYLERLTKVSSVDDLLQIVRDAATWALASTRKDREDRK